jgi:hypothetical protein
VYARSLHILVLCVATACAPLAPPPLFARHAGAAQDPRGAVTITVAVGVGGATLSAGTGFLLAARWQAADDLALGATVGYGWGDGDPDETVATTRLLGLRLHGQANPFGTEHAALAFGVGANGLNTGVRALTLDAGAVASATLGDTLEPSLGVAAALSLPVVQGRAFGRRDDPVLPTTTFYLGGSAGLGLRFGGNLLSGEAGAYLARSTGGESTTAIYLSAADGQRFTP